MAYLGKTPSQAVRSRYYFTATGGETSLSGTDDNSNTLTFTDGNYVDVSLNGVALVAGTDYNTTTANTIGGLAALTASDVVEVVVYDTFSVFGGKVLGDFDISNGTLSAEAVTVTGLTTTGDINFGDNDKAIFGASSDLQIFHDTSHSYIQDTSTGDLRLTSNGSGVMITKTTTENMARFLTDGAVELYYDGGTYTTPKLATTSTGIDVTGTVTADGLTVDTDTLAVDATNDFVGINTTTQAGWTDADDLVITNASGNHAGMTILNTNTSNNSVIAFADGTTGDAAYRGAIEYLHGSDAMRFRTAATERLRIDSSGNVGIGTTSPARSLSVVDGTAPHIQMALSSDQAASNGFELAFDGTRNYIVGRENVPTVFYTNNAERLRIDSSGNVGIGESSPANLLHVKASDTGIAPHASAQIVLEREGTNYLQFLTAETGTSGILFGDGSDIDVAQIKYDHSATSMQFVTETSEAMRIDHDGRMLLGDTTNVGTADHKLSIQKGTGGRCLGLGTTLTTASVKVSFVNGNGTVGTIQTSGTSTSYNTSSDHRLKQGVEDMTGAIDRVKALAPKRFQFIADADTTVDGFLAHEAQAVVPEAVTGTHNEVDEDGNAVMQGIDQAKLVPLLTGALREAIAKIETLETSNADLIARIETLENA